MTSLLRPDSLPVDLPSDDRPAAHRGLAMLIAVLVVVAGAALGLVHQEVWEDVGADVTRLLPASTPLFAHAPRPWAQLDVALGLDRWESRSELSHAAATRGLLADGRGGRLAGLPLSVTRKAALAADAIRLATVPTAAGTALLVFFEVDDPWARSRVLAALGPYLESVDRVLGHDVQALTGAVPAWLPWADQAPDTRLVVMDSHIVVSIGPPAALEDLLKARVTGRSQPIARREGFAAEQQGALDAQTALWAFLDPPAVYDRLAGWVGAHLGDAVGLRAFAADRIRAISLRGALSNGDDRIELRVLTEPSTALDAVDTALSGGDHELLHRLPLAPELALSVGVDDLQLLARTVGHVAGVLSIALGRPLASGSAGPPAIRMLEALAETPLAGRALPFTGRAVLALVEDEPDGAQQWVLLLGCRDAPLAERQLDELLGSTFIDAGWSLGTLYRSAAGPLHVLRRTLLEPDRERTPDLYWRRVGDLVVMAPSRDLLARATVALPDRRAAAGRLALRRALRNLQDEPVVLVADIAALDQGAPAWLRLMTDSLSDGFRVALGLHVDAGGLRVRSNVGVLTALGALAAADPATLDALVLADLPDRCRAAFSALCRASATAPLCGTFLPGRRQLVERACLRLDEPTRRLPPAPAPRP